MLLSMILSSRTESALAQTVRQRSARTASDICGIVISILIISGQHHSG